MLKTITIFVALLTLYGCNTTLYDKYEIQIEMQYISNANTFQSDNTSDLESLINNIYQDTDNRIQLDHSSNSLDLNKIQLDHSSIQLDRNRIQLEPYSTNKPLYISLHRISDGAIFNHVLIDNDCTLQPEPSKFQEQPIGFHTEKNPIEYQTERNPNTTYIVSIPSNYDINFLSILTFGGQIRWLNFIITPQSRYLIKSLYCVI